MTPEDLVVLTKAITQGAVRELSLKAPDYAPDGVCFVDLIQQCAEIELPRPEQLLWALMSKHTTAIRRYAMTGTVMSETLLSRTHDTINFASMIWIWASQSTVILMDVAHHFQSLPCECPEPMAPYPLDDQYIPCPRCVVLGWYARHHPDSLTVSTSARDSSDSTPKPPA